jgi:hypothetical protein
MLHGIKTLCVDAGNSQPDIVTSEMEQTDGGRGRNVLAWVVTWSGGVPTFTNATIDSNNPGGHEVGVWLEGSTPFVFTANHGRGDNGSNPGTVELRIYDGQ